MNKSIEESGRREMTGAEMVVQALRDNGVKHLFGYPGGAVLPIYDELFQQDDIQHILVRHEQGAGHAAEGYARSTGKAGVMLVTSGPGATNAVTPLQDALMDSIPLVCLTGQVPTSLIGSDAFQECDTVGITRPCTKHNWLVKDVNELAATIHEAFHVATTGRPGPVVVDIPKDVQFAKGIYTPPQTAPRTSYQPKVQGDLDKIREAVALMASAKQPVIYSGGGVINSGPGGEPSAARTGRADRLSDHLDADGARRLSGERQELARHARHARHLRSQHGDARLRRHDLHRRALRRPHHRPDQRVLAELEEDPHRHRPVLDQQERACRRRHSGRCRPGARRHRAAVAGDRQGRQEGALSVVGADRPLAGARLARLPAERRRDHAAICGAAALRATKDMDTYITTEVGQHQMWAAQHYHFEKPNRWMTSGGLGTMGYGLPAALGVQIAHPDSLVIDIAGDASVQMTMQEMSTAVQYEAPIKIFILNNQYMGMVRQWQQLLHGNRLSHSYTEAMPDFVKLAEAYGGHGIRCEKPGELDDAIAEMIAVKKPVIFDCRVAALANCFPMIPSGKAHNEMLLPDEATDEAVANAIDAKGRELV